MYEPRPQSACKDLHLVDQLLLSDEQDKKLAAAASKIQGARVSWRSNYTDVP